MSVEPMEPVETGGGRLFANYRSDAPQPQTGSIDEAVRRVLSWERPARLMALVVMATVFVFIGGASLELGPIEARLGLASNEHFAPLGRVFGGWEPSLWPAQVLPSLIWAQFEWIAPTANSVRWPAAIAGALIGLILCRSVATFLTGRAGVLVGLCWLGSLGMIDRSAGAGIDLLTGLATVAAFDRLLTTGSDLIAGILTAMALLAGGWPPVAIVLIATIVIGRRESALSARLLVPPVLALVAWSAWTLRVAPAEAWGAALTVPITQKPAWLFAVSVAGLTLPWTPLALLAVFPTSREGWEGPARSYVVGWMQVAGACLIAGTIVPGLALAAKVPALAGLAVASGAMFDRLMHGAASSAGRKWIAFATLGLALIWLMLATFAGGYLAVAVSYYRVLAVEVIIASVIVAGFAGFSAAKRDLRGSLFVLAALAILIKVAHTGYYVPEWNYRRSQGPWGRAIGQWVLPRWPIYTTHAWAPDLAFAIARPVRHLKSAHHLAYQPGQAKFLLLLESEFEHWPENAPKLEKVASMLDEYGVTRIVARTAGELPWTRMRVVAPEE